MKKANPRRRAAARKRVWRGPTIGMVVGGRGKVPEGRWMEGTVISVRMNRVRWSQSVVDGRSFWMVHLLIGCLLWDPRPPVGGRGDEVETGREGRPRFLSTLWADCVGGCRSPSPDDRNASVPHPVPLSPPPRPPWFYHNITGEITVEKIRDDITDFLYSVNCTGKATVLRVTQPT